MSVLWMCILLRQRRIIHIGVDVIVYSWLKGLAGTSI